MGLSCLLGWRKPGLSVKDLGFKVFLVEIRWMSAHQCAQHWVTGGLVFKDSPFSLF